MLKRLCPMLVLAVLAIGGSGTAQARDQVTIYAGVYICYTYDHTYSGGVALYTDNRYAYSYPMSGNRLSSPRYGRIRITGSRIAFLRGPWGGYHAVIKTARKMAIYLKGGRYPYTWCTLRRGF